MGDTNAGSSALNLQGSSSTNFCNTCKAKLSKQIYGLPGELRTMEELIVNGNLVEKAVNLSKKRMEELKRQCSSSNGVPFLKSIPLERFCPPPLHINMTAFNILWRAAVKENPEK